MIIFQYNNLNQKKYDMPQLLYTKIYNDLFSNAGYQVNLITDLNEIKNINKNNFIIIDSFIYMRNFQIINENKPKLIIINIEPLTYTKRWDFLFDILIKADIVIDYSINNIKILNEKNIKTIFIPLGYNQIHENIYNQSIKNPKQLPKKDIDVLFYGTLSKRRQHIFNTLKDKCNLVIKNSTNIHAQNLLIQRTKMVIIINADNTITNFDFARSSYLISNKIPVIHELIHPNEDVNNLSENIIMTPYNNIINKTIEILNLPENERNEIAEKQYQYFKKIWNTNNFCHLVQNIE